MLINDATDADPRVSDVSLGVGSRATAAQVRGLLASRLGVPADSLLMSSCVVRHDGVKWMQVRDDSDVSFAAGVVERPWAEMDALPWLWPAFSDSDVVPAFDGRALLIRASTAPLRPFSVVNEAGFHNNVDFVDSFPLRDGGTAEELRNGVGRFMDISPSSLRLLRPLCRRQPDLIGAMSFDQKWTGFSEADGSRKCGMKDVEWSWEPMEDKDPVPLAPNSWTRICVRRNNSSRR